MPPKLSKRASTTSWNQAFLLDAHSIRQGAYRSIERALTKTKNEHDLYEGILAALFLPTVTANAYAPHERAYYLAPQGRLLFQRMVTGHERDIINDPDYEPHSADASSLPNAESISVVLRSGTSYSHAPPAEPTSTNVEPNSVEEIISTDLRVTVSHDADPVNTGWEMEEPGEDEDEVEAADSLASSPLTPILSFLSTLSTNLSTSGTSPGSTERLLRFLRFTDYAISMAYLNEDGDETERYILAVCEVKLVPRSKDDRQGRGVKKAMNKMLPQVIQQMQMAMDRHPEQQYISAILLVNEYAWFMGVRRGQLPELTIDGLRAGRLPSLAETRDILSKEKVIITDQVAIFRTKKLRSGGRSVSYTDKFQKNWNQYVTKPSFNREDFPK